MNFTPPNSVKVNEYISYLRNLTIQQVKKAIEHPSGAKQIVFNEHKTEVDYRDIDIVVTPALAPFLKIYLDSEKSRFIIIFVWQGILDS